jgi:hypothetical protein
VKGSLEGIVDAKDKLNQYHVKFGTDLECLVILEDVFEITPAIVTIMNWALRQSGTHMLVTSRFNYSELATASFKWEPKKDHIFFLESKMMQVPDKRHPMHYGSDKQLFLNIAYNGQTTTEVYHKINVY